MKRIIAAIVLLFIISNNVFAYSIKVYNKKGYLIGTARKVGEDYEIYDLDGHPVKDFDAFYASKGNAEKRILKSRYFPYIPGLDWAGAENRNIKTIKNDKGESVTVLRYNPFLVHHLKVKIYDKTGKFIGYAKTDGTTDFKFYDREENPTEFSEQVYIQPGIPLKSYWHIFDVHKVHDDFY